MPPQPKPSYDLSDSEKRDLITLIEQGKSLPEKYRFILFEDKREVELVWNGKTRDVCTTVLPFQTLEHVDEPRTETKSQQDLFDSRGRQLRGWTNKLIWGDNKLILSSLKSGALRQQIEDAGGLKLIYIDPPFDVGADFSMDIEIGGETFHKEPNLLEQIAYRDTWGRGADSFIAMLYERLVLLHDLLASDGVVYVHIGWGVAHLIRSVIDEVFGRENAINEIIWKRQTAHSDSGQGSDHLGRIHDLILLYSKSSLYTWNLQYLPYDETYIASHYSRADEDGRRYRLDNLTAPGGAAKGNPTYAFLGVTRFWRYSQEKMEALYKAGRVVQTRSGTVPQYKRFLDEMPGVPVQDIWDDIPAINSQAKEAAGYATQKPEALLERIIRASSNPGDLIADFFAGSGTTAAVAEKLGRKWIATDLGKFAIHTTRKRLINVQRELKAAEKPFRAFEVLNLGRYERQAYLNISPRLNAQQKSHALAQKEAEFRDLILRAYKAASFATLGNPTAATQEPFFHGTRNNRLVVIGPINLPVGRLFVEEVITECRKRGATRCDILAFEFEMGLFPAALEEARSKGIDVSPKYIPAEVFDKRAVDRGQVVFHDISFVEAKPIYDRKNKLTLQIQLTDFSVYYTQGAAEAAIAAMKEGKSDVICNHGQLYKISKSKAGIITQTQLTKTWTDWVDYWAVDFDYYQRKEVIRVATNSPFATSQPLPGLEPPQSDLPAFEDRWTGGYIFENEWQSFRTRQNRELELTTAPHTYPGPGRYTIAIKVIDIFGNDTMTLLPVTLG